MRARLLVALLVLVVATTGTAIPGNAHPFPAPETGDEPAIQNPLSADGTASPVRSRQVNGPDPAGTTIDPVRTNLTVRLRPNGDANWTVTTELALDGPNETRAFENLGDRYEAGRAEVGPSITPFERALAATNPGTDRQMALLDRTRSASHNDTNTTGFLSLQFVWTNFATESGGRLRVGDAFRTPRGTWLPGLTANQTLTFVPPPGYGVNSAPTGPDNGTLRWSGPVAFEPGYLTITYDRGLQAATTTTAPPPDTDSGTAILPAAGGLLVVAVVAIGLYVRSRGFGSGLGEPDRSAEAASRESKNPSGNEVAGASNGTDDAGSDPTGFDEDLLSDEERIERLLASNGGRMRQAAIVTETEWSNAKVSQLLSAMDREGRVEKLRIGRENLISLPEEDTGDAGT